MAEDTTGSLAASFVPTDHSDRVVSRLAAAVSYGVTIGVVLGISLLSVASGWRPTSDDAVFAWRAWDVFSRRPPLLGAPTHSSGTTHQVFAPGPVLSWLLAVPTHLAPEWGPLVGSAVLACALMAVAVAAARAWRGDLAGLVTALALMVLCSAQHSIVLDPLWTPWIGVLAFGSLLCAALPVMDGKVAWAAAVVVTASIAAQAHVIYVIPCVAVALGSIGLGAVTRWRGEGGRSAVVRALGPAAVVGVVVWLPTLVDEIANSPGNLTLIWDNASSGAPAIGYSSAVHGLASAVAPDPSWLHAIPVLGSSSVFAILAQLFGAPVYWALVAAGLLALAVWRGGGRRSPALRNLALLALVADLTVVVAVATVPSADVLELGYLAVVLLPPGILTWTTVIWLGVDLLAPVVRHRVPLERRPVGLASTYGARSLAAGALVVTAALLATRLAAQVPSDASILGGTTAVRLTGQVADEVTGEVGRRTPFELTVTGRMPPLMLYAVQSGAAYRLHVAGWRVQVLQASTDEQIGIPIVAGPGLRRVTCELDGRRCRESRP